MNLESSTPKVLETEEDHELALERVANLMDAAPGSSEEKELEVWGMLIEEYEQKVHPINPPDATAATSRT
jgi:HTH-type transcriptional regulator/antitoxin HigA